MRILILHSTYLSGPASGENRVVEDEAKLLREAGHEVSTWMPSLPDEMSSLTRMRTGIEAVWSRSAERRVRAYLREQVDVVHVHNLFPILSPSVIRAAAREGVNVVATLHNFRMACLPATFLRNGQLCEDCVGRVPWPGVLHRCYRGSAGASAALATSLTVHRNLGTFGEVALFLAVSDFVRKKHIESGLEPERIVVKHNFAWPSEKRSGPGKYFLYLGRLSPEKGVAHLLEAWKEGPGSLLIAGDGPDRARLERHAPKGVHFVGMVSPGRGNELIRGARAVIVPSTCYEGAPRVISEAYAAGVPVVASDIGGLPESVKDDASGFLFPPGNVTALREAVVQLGDDATSVRLGAGAHRLWSELYAPHRVLRALEEAYALAALDPLS